MPGFGGPKGPGPHGPHGPHDVDEADINKANEELLNCNEEIIPDYDYLFQNTEGVKVKGGRGFISRIFANNFWKIILSTIFYIIKASPAWVIPIVTSNIINIVSAGYNDGTIWQIAINSIVCLVSILQNIPTNYIYFKINNKLISDISAGMKCSVVRKLQQLSITYHKDIHTGRLQSKFLRDTENVNMYIGSMLNSLIPNIIGFIIAAGIAIYKSGLVSLFFLIIVPIYVLLARVFRKILMKANHDFRVKNEVVSEKMTNMLEMMPVTKAHGLESEEQLTMRHYIFGLRKAGLRVEDVNSVFTACMWVTSVTMSFICLIFCSYMALKGFITVGDVVLYQSLYSSISNSVAGLVGVIPNISKGRDAVRSITEIMDSKDIELNLNQGKEVDSISGKIDFNNVYYKYPHTDADVIKDFSLSVNAGECIAIVGSSGSGKTTLMNMIIGFLMPTAGEILIDGKSIKEINLTEYRQKISVVSQNGILFPGSIKENITYGMTTYTQEQLDRVLEMANINEFLKELPEGINTNVGERGEKLSGGQRQRVTIARALIRNPSILILDEATSALDNISEYHVQKAINESIKGRTTFVVAHRLSTIRNADRIVVLEGGIIVEVGSYDELIEKKGRFYELKKLNEFDNKKAQESLGENY